MHLTPQEMDTDDRPAIRDRLDESRRRRRRAGLTADGFLIPPALLDLTREGAFLNPLTGLPRCPTDAAALADRDAETTRGSPCPDHLQHTAHNKTAGNLLCAATVACAPLLASSTAPVIAGAAP
jgi:hypothetical protein